MRPVLSWTPRNPEYEKVVREGFSHEPPLALIGASLAAVGPGYVEIELPCRDAVMTSYAAVVHGGILALLADSAMAHAALTLAPAGASGVTLEYKINLLGPAVGEKVTARGLVVKPGSRVTVARAEVSAVSAEGTEKLVATALGTLIAMA